MSENPSALTVVIGFRDRDLQRLARCLDSLQQQTFRDFVVHLVDYGSAPDCSRSVANAASKYDFCHYIYTETRGYPWNRSHALNIGARRADSKYILTTDADMVFPTHFLDTFMSSAGDNKALYCFHHFLPEGFDDWDNLDSYRGRLPTATKAALGACQCIPSAVFQRLRGFDEYYQYWGVEDRDMHQRIMRSGLEEEWMNDKVTMYHQWHPPADVKTRGFMPSGHWARMQNHYHRNAEQTVRNDERWGSVLTAADRPVFRFLDFDAMRLKPSPDLVMFQGSVYNERDAGRFVREFWELPSGRAIAVCGTALPARSSGLDKMLGAINRTLRYAGASSRVEYATNAIFSYVAELLQDDSCPVSDYFLNLPVEEGCSVLLRS